MVYKICCQHILFESKVRCARGSYRVKAELFGDDVGSAICADPSRLGGLFRLAAVAARAFAGGELRFSNGIAMSLADIGRLGNMTARVVQDLFRMLHSAGWLEVLPEPVATAIIQQAELFEPARTAPAVPSFLHETCTGPVQVSAQRALVVPTSLTNTSSIPHPNNQDPVPRPRPDVRIEGPDPVTQRRLSHFFGSGPPMRTSGRTRTQMGPELDLVRTALPGRLQALGLTQESKATLTTWDRYLRLAVSRGHDPERFLEFVVRNVAEVQKDKKVRSVGGVVTRRLQQEFCLPRRRDLAGRGGQGEAGSALEVRCRA